MENQVCTVCNLAIYDPEDRPDESEARICNLCGAVVCMSCMHNDEWCVDCEKRTAQEQDARFGEWGDREG